MSRKLKGMRPSPVYEGHFTDGTVLRMSFYQIKGKPYDFEAGRNLMKPGVRMVLTWTRDGKPLHVLPAHLEGKVLANGFVEHDMPNQPFVRIRDPFFTGEVAPVKKRASIKDARAVIRALLEETGELVSPETLAKAEQLLAA